MPRRTFSKLDRSVRDILLEVVLGCERPSPPALDALVSRILAFDDAAANGAALCTMCGDVLGYARVEEQCPACVRSRGGPEELVCLGGYTSGLGVLLSTAKYGRWPEVLHVLGGRLGVVAGATFGSRVEPPILVPMPMPLLRRWHRGINHARELAHAVSTVSGWECAPLLRRGWEATQVGASRSQRPRGARSIRPAWFGAKRMKGRTIVLVDDVRTSGTSLARASRWCRRLGAAKVVAAVVAVRRRAEESGIKTAPGANGSELWT